MKKGFYRALTSLFVVLAMLVTSAADIPFADLFVVTASAEAIDVSTWDELYTALNALSSGSTAEYNITADLTDTNNKGYLPINKSVIVTLNLNGHTLNRNRTTSALNGSVIIMSSTSRLTINGDGGKITGGNTSSTKGGGGIYVDSRAVLTLNNVTIEGNTATGNGGGIYFHGSQLNIYDSSITRNTAQIGGGIYQTANSIHLTNVSITENTPTGYQSQTSFSAWLVVSGNTNVDNIRISPSTSYQLRRSEALTTGAELLVHITGTNSLPNSTKSVPIGQSFTEEDLKYLHSDQDYAFGLKKEGSYTNLYIGVPVTVTLSQDNATTAGTTSFTAIYNCMIPTITVPERTGYTFDGYFDAAEGGTQYYNADGTSTKDWDKSSDTTLYAHWTANTRTVSFDSQGGSSVASQTVNYNAKATKPTDPTKTGYTFGGWYKEEACTNAWNFSSDTVDDDITLYAKWTKIIYTISYTLNSGSVSGTNPTSYDVETAAFTLINPTRIGYTFKGWSGTGLSGDTNTTVSVAKGSTGNRTYTANWTANTYTVTLNNQSATTAGTASVTATYGSAMPSITKPTKTGYTFGGYYTETNGGGTQYYTSTGASARNWDKTSATTLYAKWTANTYTVTLNKNNGTGGTNSVTATYDSAMPSATMPTRTGYTFAGYYDTSAATGGTQYYTSTGASAKNWNKTSDTTLYARWTANTYTVTLDNNGGSGGTNSVTATYDSAMPSATMPTRTGYTFAGYYDTSAATGGTQYYTSTGASARTWNKTSNTTLYARWTANTNTAYTVEHYQQNTAKNGYILAYTDHLTGTSDSKVTPAVKSYTGFTAPSAQEITIAPDGSTVLMYYYTRNDYSITLNTNGGTINAGNVTEYTYGVGAALPTDVTKSGYTFGGWYENSNLTGSAVTAISISAVGDKTYYAKWLTNLTSANLSLTPSVEVYSGTAKTPVIMLNHSTELAEGTDYTCTYKDSSGTTVSEMKNVGTYTVVVTGKGNYSTPTPVELSYQIVKKTVTITNLSAKDKVYDGSTAAQLNGIPQLSGAVTGEAVSLDISGVTGNFADKNVGSGKTVTFSGFSLSGTESVLANYNLSVPPTVTASITAKQVTATVTAVDRAYEPGVRTVALTAGTVSGVVDGDTVTVDISAAIGTMSDDSAGTDKSVSVTGVTLGGADAGNYELSAQPAGVTVDIAAMGIAPTLTLEYTETGYDRTAKQPAVTVKNGENVIPSDQYSVEYLNNTNAGTATVTVTCKSGVNYSFSTLQAQFTITPKTVSAPAIELSPDTFIYDGTAKTPAVTVKDGTVDIPADEYTVTFENNTNAGTATVIITDKEGGNYTVSGSTTFTIQPKAIIAAITLAETEYTYNKEEFKPEVISVKDGDTTISPTEYTVTYSDNINAGTATVTLHDADGGNYTVSGSTSFSILPKPLTVTSATATGRAYDRTAIVEITGVVLDGIIEGDEVFAVLTGVTGTIPAADAGHYTMVSLPALTLAGEQAANYTLSASENVPTDVTISKAPAVISVETNAYNKTYGDPAFVLEGITTSGDDEYLVYTVTDGTGVISLSGSTVTILTSGTAVVTVSLPESTNYLAAAENKTITITVIRAEQTISYTASEITKTYGDAPFINPLSGAQTEVTYHSSNPDVAEVNGATGEVTIKKVGTATITASAAETGEYAGASASYTLTVVRRSVNITGLSAADKVYDKTTAAEITGTAVISYMISGDDLSVVMGTANFDSKMAGTGKAVHFTGFSLSGTDADNYILSGQPADVTADISPKELTIAGITVSDKEYDSSTNAVIDERSAQLIGKFDGDDVGIAAGTHLAYFDDKNVGSGKTVTLAGYSLTGADAGNYTLSDSMVLTASITKKPVTVTVSAVNRAYEKGNFSVSLTPGAVNGKCGDDDVYVELNGAEGIIVDDNAGVDKPVTISKTITLGGADAANYMLTEQPTGLTVNIFKAIFAGERNVNISEIYGKSGNVDIASCIAEGGVLNAPVITDTNSILSPAPILSGTELSFTIADDSEKVGSTAVVVIPVTSENYENYNITVTITAIDKLEQPMSFDESTVTVEYGSAAFTKEPEGAQGTVTYASSDPTVADVDTNSGEVTVNKVGSTTITAVSSATSDYNEKSASYTLAVTPKEISLEWSGTSFTYDKTEHIPSAEAAGLVDGDTCTVTVTGAQTNAGTYTAAATALSDTNYKLPASALCTFTIEKAVLTITSVIAENRDYNGTDTVVITSVSLSGILPGDVVSVDVNGLTGKISSPDAGTYSSVLLPADIALTGAEAGNYTVSGNVTVSTNVTISKAVTVLTVTDTTFTKTYGDGDFLLTGISSTGGDGSIVLTVTSGSDVISLFGKEVSILRSGNAQISVSVPETLNFSAAGPVIVSVTINKAAVPPNMPESPLLVPYETATVGEAPLPYNWTWDSSDSGTKIPEGGSTNATAVYVAADADCYITTAVSVTITRSEHIHSADTPVRENEVLSDCTNGGMYDLVTYCTICGYKMDSTHYTTDPLGHTSASPVRENEVLPTCTTDGSYDETVYCSVCGELLSSSHQSTPALGHSYDSGVVTVAPTCTADGVRTFTCSRCDDSYTVSIPATGHTPGSANHENEIPATCTESGSYDEVVRCSVCHEILSSVHCDVPATGHDYGEGSITTLPTCTEEGVRTFTCSHCGDSYTESIAPAGHTPGVPVNENVVAATCTNDGSYDEVIRCAVCDAILTSSHYTSPALGHDYDNGTVTVRPTCTSDGLRTFTCSRCGDSYTETIIATGHTPAAAVRENETVASCTSGGYYDEVVRCSVCGEILSSSRHTTESLGHNFVNGVCTRCGLRNDSAQTSVSDPPTPVIISDVVTTESTTTTTTTTTTTASVEELPIVSEDDVSDIDTTTTIEDTDENVTAPGEVENITDKEHNYLHADLDISHEDIADELLNNDDLSALESGADIVIYLEITDISGSISEEEQAAIAEAIGDMQIGTFIDASLFKRIGNGEPSAIHKTKASVKVSLEMPETLIQYDPEVERHYSIVRIHEGEVEIIPCSFDKKSRILTFETDRFSTYAIAFKDKPIVDDNPPTGTAPVDAALPTLFIAISFFSRKRKKRCDKV